MSDLRNDVDTNAMASVDDWAAEQTPGFLLWNLENIWQREQRRALSPTASHQSNFSCCQDLQPNPPTRRPSPKSRSRAIAGQIQ